MVAKGSVDELPEGAGEHLNVEECDSLGATRGLRRDLGTDGRHELPDVAQVDALGVKVLLDGEVGEEDAVRAGARIAALAALGVPEDAAGGAELGQRLESQGVGPLAFRPLDDSRDVVHELLGKGRNDLSSQEVLHGADITVEGLIVGVRLLLDRAGVGAQRDRGPAHELGAEEAVQEGVARPRCSVLLERELRREGARQVKEVVLARDLVALHVERCHDGLVGHDMLR
mmetsp:Transcript_9950/g.27960  ORF Transcript_9950/g.27960 Transcript_9950/m.27960 type:complete len:229 (-) Transcript_9950:658-1344(-)